MHFSPSTLMVVAGMLASPLAVSAGPIDHTLEDRTFNFGLSWGASLNLPLVPLCTLQNYGAKGAPWQSWSSPAAWCGTGSKPSGGQWGGVVTWDGGFKTKCSSWNWWWYSVCYSSGNSAGSLPSGCNPPHSGGGGSASTLTKTQVQTVTVNQTVTATTTATVTVTTAAPQPPSSNPVCDGHYQAQYLNYTTVAQNGVYAGQTVGAALQDASYLTYTLSDTIEGCLAACDGVTGCVFVNTYYDVNAEEANLPKHAPGTLTCAMFSKCVSSASNNNWGGQDDPNSIVESDGWCKSGNCGQ